MNWATTLLATNPTILAIVNIIALLGGLAVLLKIFVWLWRFCKASYQTSILSAIKRYRGNADELARRCSEDVIYFISKLTILALGMILGYLGLLVSAFFLSFDTSSSKILVRAGWIIVGALYSAQAAFCFFLTGGLAARVGRLRRRAMEIEDDSK